MPCMSFSLLSLCLGNADCRVEECQRASLAFHAPCLYSHCPFVCRQLTVSSQPASINIDNGCWCCCWRRRQRRCVHKGDADDNHGVWICAIKGKADREKERICLSFSSSTERLNWNSAIQTLCAHTNCTNHREREKVLVRAVVQQQGQPVRRAQASDSAMLVCVCVCAAG